MKLNRNIIHLKSLLRSSKRRFFKFKVKAFRTTRMVILKNGPYKMLKKYGKIKASHAIVLILKALTHQFIIRPRVKLVARTILLLLLILFGSQIAVNNLKSRESEIKVNGKAVLVANKPADIPEQEISAEVAPKLSPFSYTNPVESGVISQGYGVYHKGIDIATGFGSEIKPIGEGKVEFTGYTADGKGNVVIIDHGDGLRTIYAHLGKIEVGVGNIVTSESVIGTVGLTGRTTGPHLHLEVYDGSVAMNPSAVLP